MATLPLAQTLGDHVASLKLDELPPEVVEKARLVILDSLASAISGWDTAVSRQARAFGAAWRNPAGTATAWAEGFPVNPLDAIFVNTTLVHSLLRDDSLPGTSTHGGSIIVPTALALAEHTRAPGARVLLAAIAAYDVQGRLGARYGVSGPITDKGYRGTPVFGPFSGATAAAVILGLDGERAAAALNLAANFSGGLLETMRYGTPEYRYQNANAGRCGATAAMLAGQGAEVAPTTLDGNHGFLKVFAGLDEAPEYVCSEFGERFEIMRVLHKPYPTCGNNIRAVRTFERAFQQRGIKAGDVAEIRLRVNPHSKNYPGCDYQGPFRTLDQALLSTQFAIAAVHLHGRLTTNVYDDVADPRLAEIARRIHLAADPKVNVGLLDCCGEVTLTGGERFTVNASPEDDGMFNLDRRDAVIEFHELTETALPLAERQRIVELVLGLDDLDDVRQLTFRLRQPTSAGE